ncbi:tetratricopeptide repeat protein [Ectobacillus ponti]|uniref:Tetratricopeptide repeat protein n=1 Tax=Ectobacillus ponti TaxID=2961894 RepID=A0AA41XAS3_9BACI|nr:tetratricopeptide repeat protein [Ectobacillus ponti]
MEQELNRAIALRESGQKQEANERLVKLAQDYPDDALVCYQCAWSYDAMGEERKAVPYYERAIELGLAGRDLAGAYLGLGSSYRTLGEYEKAKRVLGEGMVAFPGHQAMKVFYAMALYNRKEAAAAMEVLLRCLLDATEDESILHYKRAIAFYSDKLDETWE